MEWILWLVLILTLIWAVVTYNRLIQEKNRVLAAWSDIGVQLKRRYDLIPKLVAAVNAYASYEQSVLEEITQLRSHSEQIETPNEKGYLEEKINGRLRELLAVAEAYPDLKANRQFLDLQRQLTQVEEQIQFARRYYNGAVRNLNVQIDSFPDLLIARLFRFHPAEFFQLESITETSPPEIL